MWFLGGFCLCVISLWEGNEYGGFIGEIFMSRVWKWCVLFLFTLYLLEYCFLVILRFGNRDEFCVWKEEKGVW